MKEPLRWEFLCHALSSLSLALLFGSVFTCLVVLPPIRAKRLACLGYHFLFLSVLRVNCAVRVDNCLFLPCRHKSCLCAGIKQGCLKHYYLSIVTPISWGLNGILPGSPTRFFFKKTGTRDIITFHLGTIVLWAKCVTPARNPSPDCGFSMSNNSPYNQRATNCVIDNVLITIHKRHKLAKMGIFCACRGICIFQKTPELILA
jgi:hypothetical protein